MEQTSLAAPGMTEAMMKLATFWHDENADISSIDATHVSICWRRERRRNHLYFLSFLYFRSSLI